MNIIEPESVVLLDVELKIELREEFNAVGLRVLDVNHFQVEFDLNNKWLTKYGVFVVALLQLVFVEILDVGAFEVLVARVYFHILGLGVRFKCRIQSLPLAGHNIYLLIFI